MRLPASLFAPAAALRPRIGLAGGWSALWLLLAVLHVTQGIWLSGGTAWPGDLGDGRFNQLLLEHGYQSLRGVYDWASPAQFFPATDTLGLSDTHAGTLPIYAALRFLGYSIDHAWQQWFIVVAALNAFAAFRLFAALGIGRWLRGPLVFAAVASVTTVWLAGTHMQMLPMFPILFAGAELVRWHADRAPRRLAAAFGWSAWQFAAGPYLAFFGLGFLAAVGGLRLLFRARAAAPERSPSRWRAVVALVIGLAGPALALAVALVYFHAVKSGASRSLEEVRDLAPRLQSWFTASPAHRWYPTGWPGHMANHVEQAWLSGFLPWLLLVPALVVGWRTRATAAGAWTLALAGGALAAALFFTRWNDAGAGAWLFVADQFEGLRAFRASGRVAGLLQVVQIAAAGLLLTHWLARSPRARLWVGVVTALVVVEGLAWHQPVTPVAVAEKRAHALIAAWRAAGDQPVLAYAFGYTNQPEAYLHLDAWSAALRLQRVTLNGYSGGMPGSHHRYLWNSTADNARALAAGAGLKRDKVSIVEQLSPADEAALGLVRFDGRPVEPLDGFALQPFTWKLYAFLERFVLDGRPVYQFTPPAELRFRVPDGVHTISYLVGFRPDAYSLGGQTDGGGVTWTLQAEGQTERPLAHELLTPRTRPEHRGLLPRTLELPAGRDRILILRTDVGPNQNQAWDFLLLGQFQAR